MNRRHCRRSWRYRLRVIQLGLNWLKWRDNELLRATSANLFKIIGHLSWAKRPHAIQRLVSNCTHEESSLPQFPAVSFSRGASRTQVAAVARCRDFVDNTHKLVQKTWATSVGENGPTDPLTCEQLNLRRVDSSPELGCSISE